MRSPILLISYYFTNLVFPSATRYLFICVRILISSALFLRSDCTVHDPTRDMLSLTRPPELWTKRAQLTQRNLDPVWRGPRDGWVSVLRGVSFGFPFPGIRNPGTQTRLWVPGSWESGTRAVKHLGREIQADSPFLGTQESGPLWLSDS
jgi:hypothetical protein